MSAETPRFLPYGRQSLHEDDVAAVIGVLRGDYWTTGPEIPAFEAAFTAHCGAAHAVAVSNGTAALHLAAMAAGLGPGKLAIVPDITFVATANAARFVGADVMLCDVDPDTGLMTPETLARAIEATDRQIDCVLPVHLAGQTVDMPGIRAVLAAAPRAAGAIVIEDACHAVGARYGGNSAVGNCEFSDMTVFSFHPVKTIAAGEGGMVTAAGEAHARALRRLRTHGITRDPSEFVNAEQAFAADGQPNPWYYEAQEIGFNYRLTDIQAALGRSQLVRIEAMRERRTELVELYRRELAALAPLVTMVPLRKPCVPCWHLAVALIDFDRLGIDRAVFARALNGRGVGTQVHYIPLHRQPTLAGSGADADFPGSERYYARCLSLPLFFGMTDDDAFRVCDEIRAMVKPGLRG